MYSTVTSQSLDLYPLSNHIVSALAIGIALCAHREENLSRFVGNGLFLIETSKGTIVVGRKRVSQEDEKKATSLEQCQHIHLHSRCNF